MPKPPDDYTERHDELIRKMLDEKRAKPSPEKWREWCEHMLTTRSQTVLIPRQRKREDHE
ncbi:hypothetical protein [Hyalangium versicolor]|uniref:hypothetical protein n=1 Tax=Hyalangium versicolor TaxID=2861190 RepID=UPI001CCB1E8A|nr:hypothetical protein [Hyalangium versicolor]